jgi:hypothetical protein
MLFLAPQRHPHTPACLEVPVLLERYKDYVAAAAAGLARLAAALPAAAAGGGGSGGGGGAAAAQQQQQRGGGGGSRGGQGRRSSDASGGSAPLPQQLQQADGVPLAAVGAFTAEQVAALGVRLPAWPWTLSEYLAMGHDERSASRRAGCCCCRMLCCAVLCCAVLCCAVLCCAELCCAVLGGAWCVPQEAGVRMHTTRCLLAHSHPLAALRLLALCVSLCLRVCVCVSVCVTVCVTACVCDASRHVVCPVPPSLPACNLLTGQHESIEADIWRVVSARCATRACGVWRITCVCARGSGCCAGALWGAA